MSLIIKQVEKQMSGCQGFDLSVWNLPVYRFTKVLTQNVK